MILNLLQYMFQTWHLRSNQIHNKVLSGISWAYESSEHCKIYKTCVGWLRFSARIDSFMTHFKPQLKHINILFSHLYIDKLLKTHEVYYFYLNVGNVTKKKVHLCEGVYMIIHNTKTVCNPEMAFKQPIRFVR